MTGVICNKQTETFDNSLVVIDDYILSRNIFPVEARIKLLFKINGEDHYVRVPYYYDVDNLVIDILLFERSYNIIQSILGIYGYDNIESFELDESFPPRKDSYIMDLLCDDNDLITGNNLHRRIMFNNYSIVKSCINEDYVKKNICAERLSDFSQQSIDKIQMCDCHDITEEDIRSINKILCKELMQFRANTFQFNYDPLQETLARQNILV